MKMRILALQTHMHQEEILLRDMKKHQLQAIVGVNIKPAECVQLTNNVKMPDISATHPKSPCIKEIASRGTTPG
jgi:hypothetical protein